MNYDWSEGAKCKDQTELFYEGSTEANRAAKRICATCPCIRQCRELALRSGESLGVWGGMTSKERSREQVRRVRLRRGA